MTKDPFFSAVRVRHPIYPMVAPYVSASFVGALLTDLAYWQTANVVWETFSVWLLTAGLFVAAVAVVAGVIDWMGRRRSVSPIWPRLLCRALIAVLSLINVFVHSRDGYTAVVPEGLILSAIVVVIMAVTGCIGVAFEHRRLGLIQ